MIKPVFLYTKEIGCARFTEFLMNLPVLVREKGKLDLPALPNEFNQIDVVFYSDANDFDFFL